MSQRMCPACRRPLEPSEQLKVVTGTKRTMNPTPRPPKFEIRLCETCYRTFQQVLLLLEPHFPNVFIFEGERPK